MAAVNGAVEQLKAAVDRLVREGRAEGIEPGGPLGCWLDAQVEALGGFAAVLDGQADRFEDVLAKVEAASQAELTKLAVALDLAGEVVKQGDLAVKQARNAQIAAAVQGETAVQRMIQDTLPMFADSLKGALVIREARLNHSKARRSFVLAGVVFLGVFGAGYGLSAWSDAGRLAVYDRCMASAFASKDGHVYCAVDLPGLPSVKPQATAR